MSFAPVILLAATEGPSLDILIWLAAGAFWLISQIVAARKAKEKKDRAASSRPPPAGAPGASPAPDELAEIFKRLGANIPGTPPVPRPAPTASPPRPAPAAAPRPRPAPASRQAVQIPPRAPPAPARQAPRVQPEIARRLARARQEAAEAARLAAEAEQQVLNAIVPGVQSRAGETRALDTATRHTGAILPRLYAMSMRLSNLPALPMPGLDRTHHTQTPLRTRLHGRREVREALIAQAFLQPPKSFSV
jgi:hypothetical protein